MTNNEGKPEQTATDGDAKRKEEKTMSKRKLTVRILKWLGIAVAIPVAICVIAAVTAVVYLTPDRLTPLVNRYASEYVNADIKAEQVKLSLKPSLSLLRLDIKNIDIISRAFDSIPASQREMLPVFADTLLTMKDFSGSLNIPALLTGRISIYDVNIRGAQINLVKLDSLQTNYNIMPPSEKSEPSAIPQISLRRFTLDGDTPIRYVSIPDSVDIGLKILATTLSGAKAPYYTLKLEGLGNARLPDGLLIPRLPFGLDGQVEWVPDHPYHLSLNDFTFSAGNVDLKVNARMSFADTLQLKNFDLSGNSMLVHDLIDLLPDTMRNDFKNLKTDLTVDLSVRLTKPYSPLNDPLPSAQVNITIPEGRLKYKNLAIQAVEAEMILDLNGSDLNASTINIRQIKAAGRSMGFTLSALISEPLGDTKIAGEFKGGINFSLIPTDVFKKLPITIGGFFKADASFNLRRSDLSAETFHRIKAKGNLSTNNLTVGARDSSFLLKTGRSSLRLATDNRIRTDSIKIDSLLTVYAAIDTINLKGFGIDGAANSLTVKAAVRNVSSSWNTKSITPLGFNIKADRIKVSSINDSIHVMLRDLSTSALLTRYHQNAKAPNLKTVIDTRGAFFADRFNRVAMRNGHFDLSLHPVKPRPMSARMMAKVDSLQALHPELSRDSIMRIVRKQARRRFTIGHEPDGRENIDFTINRGIVVLLRQWDMSGTVSAERTRVFSPYFPITNSLSDMAISFNTDSIAINHTECRVGRSTFTLNGHIGNITRAVSGRRSSPLEVSLDIKADTLNINDIAEAIFKGSAFGEKASSSKSDISIETESEEELQKHLAKQTDTLGRAAFIVPSNISAKVNINANNVLYADIWFQRLQGRLWMRNGAIHLDRLGAFTTMGSMDLTALYSAPSKKNLNFAAGIVVRQLDLRKFLHMMPQIDSLLPLLNNVAGYITADMAMTSELDSLMDLKFHTLEAVVKLSGDSLALIDSQTFRKIGKWLMFKHKDRNVIDHMEVELMVKDSKLDLFPFMFDLDRYKFGVSGGNDLDFNYDYHIAVLKSPLPFKFGVNIKGKPGHMRFSLGKAKFNEKTAFEERQLTDTARINLINEIRNVFSFGVRSGKVNKQLELTEMRPPKSEFDIADTLTHADSALFIKEGVIERPEGFVMPDSAAVTPTDKKKKRHRKWLLF